MAEEEVNARVTAAWQRNMNPQICRRNYGWTFCGCIVSDLMAALELFAGEWSFTIYDFLLALVFMNPFEQTSLELQIWRRLQITFATRQQDVYWLSSIATSHSSCDVRQKLSGLQLTVCCNTGGLLIARYNTSLSQK
jgi:hypothetical protein